MRVPATTIMNGVRHSDLTCPGISTDVDGAAGSRGASKIGTGVRQIGGCMQVRVGGDLAVIDGALTVGIISVMQGTIGGKGNCASDKPWGAASSGVAMVVIAADTGWKRRRGLWDGAVCTDGAVEVVDTVPLVGLAVSVSGCPAGVCGGAVSITA